MNFSTRYELNRACIQLKKPLVSGAAIRFAGQVTVFDFRQQHSPCYHCLYPESGENEDTRCAEMGVFAPPGRYQRQPAGCGSAQITA